jgi:hypothetical protein
MRLNRGLVLFAVLVTLPYIRGPIYRFPDPVVFSGSQFLNPYAGPIGAWQRANLHAHGIAWGGVTNGKQSSSEIIAAYHKLGYSLAGISDYQHIRANDGAATLPLYEHGYNVNKRHQLAIGAHAVEWFDFPLWQSPSNQQFVIDRVKAKADLVALAHPSRDSYSADDLRQLTGYDLLEVVNGPFVMEEAWDAALSSGHLVWGLANDDTHDITDRQRNGVAWNMIGADSASTADIVQALKAGRTYAVMKTAEDPSLPDPPVPGVHFNNGTLTVTSTEPSTFWFIGQNGTVRNSVNQTTQAIYTFANEDTYIRTVIRSPRTAIFVNPVVRYDGRQVAVLKATQDTANTWLWRISYAGITGAALAIVFMKRRSRQSPAAFPAVTDADRA